MSSTLHKLSLIHTPPKLLAFYSSWNWKNSNSTSCNNWPQSKLKSYSLSLFLNFLNLTLFFWKSKGKKNGRKKRRKWGREGERKKRRKEGRVHPMILVFCWVLTSLEPQLNWLLRTTEKLYGSENMGGRRGNLVIEELGKQRLGRSDLCGETCRVNCLDLFTSLVAPIWKKHSWFPSGRTFFSSLKKGNSPFPCALSRCFVSIWKLPKTYKLS